MVFQKWKQTVADPKVPFNAPILPDLTAGFVAAEGFRTGSPHCGSWHSREIFGEPSIETRALHNSCPLRRNVPASSSFRPKPQMCISLMKGHHIAMMPSFFGWQVHIREQRGEYLARGYSELTSEYPSNSSVMLLLLFHSLQLVDHPRDHRQAFVPEFRIRRV